MSQPLPDLAPLPRAQRRCLFVVSEFSDLAHAARKLHWSQADLKAMLSDIQDRLGVQHVQVADGRVQVSELLKTRIGQQRPPCRPPVSTLRPDSSQPK